MNAMGWEAGDSPRVEYETWRVLVNNLLTRSNCQAMGRISLGMPAQASLRRAAFVKKKKKRKQTNTTTALSSYACNLCHVPKCNNLPILTSWPDRQSTNL